MIGCRPEPQVWTSDRVAHELANAVDLLAPVLEAVVGYRQRCLEAGFNETAAEFMALQYHAVLLGQPVPQAQA